MKPQPLRRPIAEPLEPRRLLATLGGTDGDDIIRISVLHTEITVTVNGVVKHEVSTNTVVNASGGNDTIYLDRLVGNGISGFPLFFELDAGTGNDLIKFGSTDPANYDLGGFFDFDLIAGAGNDTLEMNMLGGASGVFFECMATTPPTNNWVTFADS
jgi:hypothetical protein